MSFSVRRWLTFWRDEGLEVIECTTAEAAELIVASGGERVTGTHY